MENRSRLQIFLERCVLADEMGHRLALTEDERKVLDANGRYGSDGYPVHKLGGEWTWSWDGKISTPAAFKTKREAVASWEAYVDMLRERCGAEAGLRAHLERAKLDGITLEESRAITREYLENEEINGGDLVEVVAEAALAASSEDGSQANTSST